MLIFLLYQRLIGYISVGQNFCGLILWYLCLLFCDSNTILIIRVAVLWVCFSFQYWVVSFGVGSFGISLYILESVYQHSQNNLFSGNENGNVLTIPYSTHSLLVFRKEVDFCIWTIYCRLTIPDNYFQEVFVGVVDGCFLGSLYRWLGYIKTFLFLPSQSVCLWGGGVLSCLLIFPRT